MAKKILTKKEIDFRNNQISSLADAVEVTAEIECGKCGKGDGQWGGGELEAAEDFYNAGWLFKYNLVYCPDCVKKYLNKK